MMDYDDEEYHYHESRDGYKTRLHDDEATELILRDLIDEVNEMHEKLNKLLENK